MSGSVAVIGAGVVGAAVAAELARAGCAVWLLDRRARTGGETTERNSGVIHAGLNHPAGWWKTRLCVEGNRLLYAWASSRGVPFRRCGKLIVAADRAEVDALEALLAHGRAAGVEGLSLVGSDGLPAGVAGRAAVLSESSGIVDPVALAASLVAEARAHGAEVITSCELRAASPGWRLETTRGELAADAVVNAAGLHADEVARACGVDRYRIHPCRGDYYAWRSGRRYERLVYPVRAKGAAGLGVHLTLDLAGNVRLGPDTTWVDAKDAYGEPAVDKRAAFAAAASRILEGVEVEALSYDACGIRPKLRAPGEMSERDFVLSEDLPGLVNLVGIESPGLTSALAIAREVARMLGA